jgi:hypothetical protein
MRALTAYFVGGGTIVAAIAIGLGGGIVAGNIMNPITPKQGPDRSRVEQRAERVAATSTPSDRVPYLRGSQVFGAPAQAETATPTAQPATPPQPAPPIRQVSTSPPPATTTADTPKATDAPKTAEASKSAEAPTAVEQPGAKPAQQQASVEPSTPPENAYAKARDTDVKRDRDVESKRAAVERRRAERRQRWADRRHYEVRDTREPRERINWDDVARNVRQDADARDYAETPRRGMPQIRLFGADDDD